MENAVQHGILNKKEGGTVTIRTEETKGGVVVTIADDGVGVEHAKEIPSLGDHAHIGISNVRNRLKEMVYGSLEMESSRAYASGCGVSGYPDGRDDRPAVGRQA